MKRILVAFALLLVVLANQQCAPVQMSSTEDVELTKAGTELGPVTDDGTAGDGTAGDPMDPPGEPQEESEQEEDDDVVCISGGIKVPASTVVACPDGDEDCVIVCNDAMTEILTFKAARELFENGSDIRAGACQ